MARAAQPVTLDEIGRGGILAAGLVVGVVAAAFAGLALRAEGGVTFGPAELSALRFTVVQSVLSALISGFLAVPLARALARRRFAGRGLLIALLGAPFILPVIVAVLGLLAVFGRSGWLNAGLAALGGPEISIYGLHGVVLAHVFFNLPLATRLLLQGWQSIPAEQFRLAAQLDLPPAMVFRTLEVPMLRRMLPGAVALVFVICLTSFAVALTLGGGPRATTIELAIYQAFRFEFDLRQAAFLSLLQLALAGGAALLALRVLPDLPLGTGLGRPLARFDATRPAQRVVDLCVVALGAGFLLLPLVAVVLAGLGGLNELPASVWRATANSLTVAALSTIALLALVLPMGALIAARPTGGLEAVGLLGLAASPLMIGTGWFILLNPVTDPVAVSLPVTAAVNALMALPFALRVLVPALRAALERHGRLARALDLRGVAFWRIALLPAVRPQLGFAAGLTAALSLGDLGVIALFADPSRATLPLEMYRLMGAYRTEAAAGAALLLLVLAFGAFAACDWGGRRRVDA
jgi:thiamine transport system permease protein